MSVCLAQGGGPDSLQHGSAQPAVHYHRELRAARLLFPGSSTAVPHKCHEGDGVRVCFRQCWLRAGVRRKILSSGRVGLSSAERGTFKIVPSLRDAALITQQHHGTSLNCLSPHWH